MAPCRTLCLAAALALASMFPLPARADGAPTLTAAGETEEPTCACPPLPSTARLRRAVPQTCRLCSGMVHTNPHTSNLDVGAPPGGSVVVTAPLVAKKTLHLEGQDVSNQNAWPGGPPPLPCAGPRRRQGERRAGHVNACANVRGWCRPPDRACMCQAMSCMRLAPVPRRSPLVTTHERGAGADWLTLHWRRGVVRAAAVRTVGGRPRVCARRVRSPTSQQHCLQSPAS